jgi:hypothetical protein
VSAGDDFNLISLSAAYLALSGGVVRYELGLRH